MKRLALALAVIVVLALIVIYLSSKGSGWVHKGFWMAHFVETPEKVYRRSGGTFDDAAQLALQRATARPNPTPDEHMLAATILTRNILAQEHQPVPTPDGKFAAADVEQAQLRKTAFERARDHYMAALQGIQANIRAPPAPVAEPRTARAPRASRRAPVAAPPPRGTGFVIDAALDFALGGMTVLIENDPVLAVMLAGMGDDDLFGQLIAVDIPLAQEAQKTRDEMIASRLAAASTAATPAAKRDAYLAQAITHTSDPQNAHDSAINAYLREMVKRLRTEQGAKGTPSLDSIVRDIRSSGAKFSENRPALVEDAVAVVNKAKAGEKNVAVDVTDEEALRLVWARADHPRNKENCNKIRQAAFDALVDSWENGITGRKIVCVSGRVSRFLAALVLLDFDKRNWETKTLEQLKNSLLELTKKIIDARAVAASKSSDAKLQAVGRSYLAKTLEELNAVGKIDQSAADSFLASMREETGQAIDAEIATINSATDGVITPPVAEGMKKEALAALV